MNNQNNELTTLLGYTGPSEQSTRQQRTKYTAELLTAEPAIQRYQKGDKQAAGEILKELDPTIAKAISAYAGGDQAYKTQARLLALEAAKSYDPSKGANLSTHVYGNLRRLQRISAQRGNLTRIPENAALERSQIQRAMREWQADHGVEPTTEDLANVTGLSRKRIDAVMNNKPVVPDSMVQTPEGENLVAAPDNQRALDLYNHAIYDELDATDKRIYEWTTGYGKGTKLPSVEIAKRLNISPAAVSQRLNKISKKFIEGRQIVEASVYGRS
jgi:DNA-directed RNA polymerase specialized sigma subunit